MGRLKTLAPVVQALQDRVKPALKIAEAFYLSPEWRRLVASIKRERGSRCEECGSRHRVIADHVVERSDGGADLDPANVKLRCFTCHQRKTALARKLRASGQVYRGG
jgi:5-methylcytosine-specific restriction protein A